MAVNHTDTTIQGLNINKFPSKSAMEQAVAQGLVGEYDLSLVTEDTKLSDIGDVTISTVSDGQVLAYDSVGSQWVNTTISTANDATLTIQKNGTTVGTFTANSSSDKTVNITVATTTSGLANDSGFITNAVNDLVNYYKTSETYTQTEVNSLIGAINQFKYEIYASTSAVSDPQGNVLYLIGPTGGGSDKYEEYVYANSTWVKIGDTTIDLSGYATTASLSTVATTGSYNDLTGTPTLATVATTGSYNDLIGTPTKFVTLDTVQQIEAAKAIFGSDVAFGSDASQKNLLAVVSDSNSLDSQWIGRMTVGAKDKTFILGAYHHKCVLGAHSWTNAQQATDAAWDHIYFEPDGDKTMYFGGKGFSGNDAAWFKIVNSGNWTGGKVYYNKGSVQYDSSVDWQEVAVLSDIGNAANFNHTQDTVISVGSTSVTFGTIGRSTQKITVSNNIDINLAVNNLSDNYLWVENIGTSEVYVTFSDVSSNVAGPIANVVLPSDGISVSSGCITEIGAIVNSDGLYITDRGGLSVMFMARAYVTSNNSSYGTASLSGGNNGVYWFDKGQNQNLTMTATPTSNSYRFVKWQQSSDNSTWSDISGATSTPYTKTITTGGTYYFRAVFEEQPTYTVRSVQSRVLDPSVVSDPNFSYVDVSMTDNNNQTGTILEVPYDTFVEILTQASDFYSAYGGEVGFVVGLEYSEDDGLNWYPLDYEYWGNPGLSISTNTLVRCVQTGTLYNQQVTAYSDVYEGYTDSRFEITGYYYGTSLGPELFHKELYYGSSTDFVVFNGMVLNVYFYNNYDYGSAYFTVSDGTYSATADSSNTSMYVTMGTDPNGYGGSYMSDASFIYCDCRLEPMLSDPNSGS